MLKWERINDEHDDEVTKRLKVFGGWLVLTTRTVASGYNEKRTVISQMYIADPNHEWSV